MGHGFYNYTNRKRTSWVRKMDRKWFHDQPLTFTKPNLSVRTRHRLVFNKLTTEVNVLHPFLGNLLPCVPRVALFLCTLILPTYQPTEESRSTPNVLSDTHYIWNFDASMAFAGVGESDTLPLVIKLQLTPVMAYLYYYVERKSIENSFLSVIIIQRY